jgi:hypothetical protein
VCAEEWEDRDTTVHSAGPGAHQLMAIMITGITTISICIVTVE